MIIHKTKVVSKNVVRDIYARLQNFFGKNLTSYERMIAEATEQIHSELDDEGVELKWFRYEISQLTNGAMAVVLYGESK